MLGLNRIIAVCLVFALGLPGLQQINCCCKGAAIAAVASDKCCCCESVTAVTTSPKSCCSALKTSRRPTDKPDTLQSTVSRRCECKPRLLSRTFQDTTIRWSQSAQFRLCETIAVKFEIQSSVNSLDTSNSPTRAPPNNLRLHVLDCRWLA